MRKAMEDIMKNSNGPFYAAVISILLLYGIQRATEKDYHLNLSTEEGQTFDFKPQSSVGDSEGMLDENEDNEYA